MSAFDFAQDRLDTILKVIKENVIKANPFDMDTTTKFQVIQGYKKITEAKIWADNLDRLLTGNLPACAGNTMRADIDESIEKFEKNFHALFTCDFCKKKYQHEDGCSQYGTGVKVLITCEEFELRVNDDEDDFSDIPF
jgi:hypothetical protein